MEGLQESDDYFLFDLCIQLKLILFRNKHKITKTITINTNTLVQINKSGAQNYVLLLKVNYRIKFGLHITH